MKKNNIVYTIICIIMISMNAYTAYYYQYRCNYFTDYIRYNNCGSPRDNCPGTCVFVNVLDEGGQCVEGNIFQICITTELYYIPIQIEERECQVVVGAYIPDRCCEADTVRRVIEYYDEGFLCNCN
ncbi:MAG: hypothetical protein ACP5MG_09785 [Verrucomicrobiia bacterium]